MSDKNRILLSIILVLVLAGAIRFYHVGWSFSSNGVDEGIMVERSLMISKGYVPYSDLPLDQAPLAFYLGSIFDGTLIDLRIMTAAFSLLAISVCMFSARRVKNANAMILTGLFLAVDFAFVRESRTFSLDGISSFFLALAILPFMQYARTGSRLALIVSAAMIGLSTASKLLGILGLVGMLVFMLVEKRKEGHQRKMIDILALIVTAAIPILVFMILLGPKAMIDGMVLDQGHRDADLVLKVSIAAFLGLNAAYLLPLAFARRLWSLGPETRFLIVTSIAILVFMILQPLTFFHHLAILSPPLAILAGICVSDMLARETGNQKTCEPRIVPRKSRMLFAGITAAVIAALVVSSGLSFYGLAVQTEPFQEHYARVVQAHSGPDDWVVSGDPLITDMAGRMTPPNALNVAYRIYPALTEESLESTILQYNVKVVVVCYRLNDMPGLADFLLSHGYVEIQDSFRVSEPVLNLFEDNVGPVTVFVHSG